MQTRHESQPAGRAVLGSFSGQQHLADQMVERFLQTRTEQIRRQLGKKISASTLLLHAESLLEKTPVGVQSNKEADQVRGFRDASRALDAFVYLSLVKRCQKNSEYIRFLFEPCADALSGDVGASLITIEALRHSQNVEKLRRFRGILLDADIPELVERIDGIIENLEQKNSWSSVA